jgi:hypothetical protein
MSKIDESDGQGALVLRPGMPVQGRFTLTISDSFCFEQHDDRHHRPLAPANRRRRLTAPRNSPNKDLIARRGQVLAACGRRSAIGAPHRSPNRSAIRGWPASGKQEWPTSGER